MYQSFDDPSGPQIAREHLPLLRAKLAEANLDGVLIPHEDEYQNEYVPAAYDRLAWASGFTGSAGGAVVLHDRAVLITDGRYRLQASAQTPEDLIEVRITSQGAIPQAMADVVREDGRALRIGYDPKLFSPDALGAVRAGMGKAAELIATDPNPIDAAWGKLRPPIPLAPVLPQPQEFTGEASLDKRQRLAEALSAAGCDAALLTAPASIAWLFNVRGGDVARTPLPLGTAFLHGDGKADVFLAPEKVSDALRTWLGNGVALRTEAELPNALHELKGRTVRLDPASASAWFFEALESAGARLSPGPDPCALPRACKNSTELDGTRAAHRRDGAALTRFLHWLEQEAQTGQMDEIMACTQLEAFRKEDSRLRDLSFDSISGAGPNGAIIHYRVNRATNRLLEPGSLFLIDSGGQYLDGTTDVTRTIAIGAPSTAMRRAYTLVLKGHIALAKVRFPPGTGGRALDALARAPLWEAGFDYDHGTGHGVGSYLGVHEGPQRIAKHASDTPLEAGMILSNEPGYYLPGGFGIRIENLQVVTPALIPAGGERPMLGFETLTLAPLDPRLIDADLLNVAERDWLNAYHARVAAEISPLIPAPARQWLLGVCASL